MLNKVTNYQHHNGVDHAASAKIRTNVFYVTVSYPRQNKKSKFNWQNINLENIPTSIYGQVKRSFHTEFVCPKLLGRHILQHIDMLHL